MLHVKINKAFVALIKKNSEVPIYPLIFAAIDNFNIATTQKKVSHL